MGVFARLLRRSRTTEEAQAAEAGAAQPTVPAEAGATDEAKDTTGAAQEAAAEQTACAAADDGVEIPRQQSAENAVDSEADQGART
jgi:hypothetical protein